MGRGVSSGGGQSSLGYLFGSNEAPKPAVDSAQPAETPAPPPAEKLKEIPAGIQGNAGNNYFRADGQNTGNFITEPSREQNLAGIKRKLVSESFLPVPPPFSGPKILLKQYEDHQARPNLQIQQSPMCQVEHQHPIVRQVHNQPPSARLQQPRQSLRPLVPPNRLPPHHNPQGQRPPYWCSVCKLNCETSFNLKQHCEGKKHKATVKEVYTGKKIIVDENQMLWCKECSVPCMNEYAYAQHCAGKKHTTRIQALQAQSGARVTYGSS